MYTAVKLNRPSIQLLTWAIKATLNPEHFGLKFASKSYALPHHMTINLGKIDTKLNMKEYLNKKAFLQVSKAVMDIDYHGVCACEVEKAVIYQTDDLLADGVSFRINTMNEKPHITCALAKDVNPVASNAMLEDKYAENFRIKIFKDPLLLFGVVQELQ